jgi:sortase A
VDGARGGGRLTGVPRTRDGRLLTLVTCAELFHTDDRLVVFGHLVDERPR